MSSPTQHKTFGTSIEITFLFLVIATVTLWIWLTVFLFFLRFFQGEKITIPVTFWWIFFHIPEEKWHIGGCFVLWIYRILGLPMQWDRIFKKRAKCDTCNPSMLNWGENIHLGEKLCFRHTTIHFCSLKKSFPRMLLLPYEKTYRYFTDGLHVYFQKKLQISFTLTVFHNKIRKVVIFLPLFIMVPHEIDYQYCHLHTHIYSQNWHPGLWHVTIKLTMWCFYQILH